MSTTPDSVFAAEPLHAPPLQAEPNLSGSGSSADNPPWRIPGAVLTWLSSVAMLFIVPNVCVLPYLAYRYRHIAATKEVLVADKTFVFLFVLGSLPAHLLTLAVIWAVATRLGKLSIKDVFGWSWGPTFGFWRSFTLAISMFMVTILLIGFFGGAKTDLDRILESSRAAAVTLAIVAVVTAPLVEEMIYRGLLYTAFEQAIGQWGAVAVVASMFAGLHVVQYWPNAGAILSITLLSVVLTLLRARTGRLLPCFVVHLVFNGVQSVIIILEPYIRAGLELWRHQPVNGAFNLLRFFN
ncbi:MAG TPA: type II CAAX endopeptidase family protein [Pyrinomonadaceae bacterium]|nr:type II CAAX endopeptidase family protein [Pyrinomonadaceae bacterium]